MNAKIYLTANDAEADRRKLAGLLEQTVDAMPEDTDPTQYAAVAWALIAQTLASATRRGLMPVREQAEMLTRCRQVLYGLTRTEGLGSFQAAAKDELRKAAVREAVCQI